MDLDEATPGNHSAKLNWLDRRYLFYCTKWRDKTVAVPDALKLPICYAIQSMSLLPKCAHSFIKETFVEIGKGKDKVFYYIGIDGGMLALLTMTLMKLVLQPNGTYKLFCVGEAAYTSGMFREDSRYKNVRGNCRRDKIVKAALKSSATDEEKLIQYLYAQRQPIYTKDASRGVKKHREQIVFSHIEKCIYSWYKR